MRVGLPPPPPQGRPRAWGAEVDRREQGVPARVPILTFDKGRRLGRPGWLTRTGWLTLCRCHIERFTCTTPQPGREGSVLLPVLLMKKMSFRELKECVQGHTPVSEGAGIMLLGSMWRASRAKVGGALEELAGAGKGLPGQGNSRSKGGTDCLRGRESARHGKTLRVAGSKAVLGLVGVSWAQGPTVWHLEMYGDSIGLDNDDLGSQPRLLAADTTAVASATYWNAGPQGHRPSPGGLSGHDDPVVAELLAFHSWSLAC